MTGSKTCYKCKSVIPSDATRCPSCTDKDPGNSKGLGCLSTIGAAIVAAPFWAISPTVGFIIGMVIWCVIRVFLGSLWAKQNQV